MKPLPKGLLEKFRAANPGARGALWGMFIKTAGRTPDEVQQMEEAAQLKLRLDIGFPPGQLHQPVPETEAVFEWLESDDGKTLVALLHERHVEGQTAMLF